MKRISKAINEGLNLIDFGNNKILKSNKVNSISIFEKGEYVYYDIKLKYNKKVGKKLAICVNDDPKEALYIVLDHSLYHQIEDESGDFGGEWCFGLSGGAIYNDIVPEFGNGWDNTEYIRTTYDKWDLSGLIWNQLKNNEYIPNIDETKYIYDYFMENGWPADLKLPYDATYRSSSNSDDDNQSNKCVNGLNNGKIEDYDKEEGYCLAMVCLKID